MGEAKRRKQLGLPPQEPPPALCKDCGKDTEPVKDGEPLFEQWDLYMVREKVWKEAGMNGYGSGYLCTPCLSKRLGRDLTNADYLARPVGVNSEGLEMEAQPDVPPVQVFEIIRLGRR